jgi:hypothetical protein
MYIVVRGAAIWLIDNKKDRLTMIDGGGGAFTRKQQMSTKGRWTIEDVRGNEMRAVEYDHSQTRVDRWMTFWDSHAFPLTNGAGEHH